ncbi:MAG TPA: dihydrofolate reductase family protein [Ignavibacteria bacterium]|nr:dihydrofolate reductase family protein [Ignavibacteria bacterium]
MRKIITHTFVTLDSVMQAPGGPDEDRTGDFAYGGWTFNYMDDVLDKILHEFMAIPFELLLGRRTYDIFVKYWPNDTTTEFVATPFNSTRKWVVSHKNINLSWNNSSLITGDVLKQIKKLKEEDGKDLWVYGSGNLVQTLLANHLIDVMHIWIFPVILGKGKRLFENSVQAEGFKLVDSVISTSGVIVATYEPGKEIKTGNVDGS